ncbi:MAG: DUF3307 domain-containing protein [Deltaproteobacteria bacterium]
MIETLAVLIFAHVLADFVFQTDWMVAHKRKLHVLLAHTGVVLATTAICAGSIHPALLLLALLHFALDAAKTWTGLKGLGAYLGDQALHLATLVGIAIWQPDLWANGLWMGGVEGGFFSGIFGADTPFTAKAPSIMALAAGLIIATRAGGFAVGFLMEPWSDAMKGGLPGGGRLIGNLERALVFLMLITGQASSIGFLIAAKSVLRFTAVKDERKFSEYVIIGTLASFAWAILAATLTIVSLRALPGIEIPDLTP